MTTRMMIWIIENYSRRRRKRRLFDLMQSNGRTKPPQKVLQALRAEVGFLCPVPHCGSPFLTWHHFDPPWHQGREHRFEGMVALCPTCHKQADHGRWSRGELQKFKCVRAPAAAYRARLPWSDRPFLLRVGGIYCVESPALVRLSNRTVLGVNRQSSGCFNLSLVVPSANNDIAIEIQNNIVYTPESPFDISLAPSARSLQVRIEAGEPSLKMFFRRLTVDALCRKVVDEHVKTYSRSRVVNLRECRRLGLPVLPAASPPSSKDLVDSVVALAREHVGFDDENKIAIVDVCRFEAKALGHQVKIDHGVQLDGVQICGGINRMGSFIAGRDLGLPNGMATAVCSWTEHNPFTPTRLLGPSPYTQQFTLYSDKCSS